MLSILPKEHKLNISKIFLYRVFTALSVFVFVISFVFLILTFFVYVFLVTHIDYQEKQLKEFGKQISILERKIKNKKENEIMPILNSLNKLNKFSFSNASSFVVTVFNNVDGVFLSDTSLYIGNASHLDDLNNYFVVDINAYATSKARIIALINTLKDNNRVFDLDNSALLSSIKQVGEFVSFKLRFKYKINEISD